MTMTSESKVSEQTTRAAEAGQIVYEAADGTACGTENKAAYRPAAPSPEELLGAVFSDETEDYRSPAEPESGDTVAVRLRTAKDTARRAVLYVFGKNVGIQMKKAGSTERFDFYEAELVCFRREVRYCFLIETDSFLIRCDKTGANRIGAVDTDSTDGTDNAAGTGSTEKRRDLLSEELPETLAEERFAFRFTPGFHVPAWAKGALQYQIFTDRFRNGNPENDVRNKEYYYVSGHARRARWEDLPEQDADIRTFYGGDLQGVTEKLDYLQSLGIEVLYFNPLFVSPSSHKYDIQDYEYIDPHFAVIKDDPDTPMQDWEKHNGYAQGYIRRVTSPENLEAGNAYFAEFCRELHRRGMKIILDGVFNHCGSFNKWMDREGIYLGKPGYRKGAYQDPDSPYRDYFRFSAKGGTRFSEYEGWWGHETLPKLNYEGSPELREKILQIAEKWASPPYSIDGWRLDVAADLGHSPEYNHGFWREFRTRLKRINPDLLIIAEHYGDPEGWLRGDQWDTVMNYDAFMEPVSWFLTGMEKHSDYRRDDLYLNGQAFFDSLLRSMAAFESPSLQCAMNELSNHDHSRFLTRTNRRIGRLESAGSAAAGEGLRPELFRAAVVMQMTLPGAPTVYYGDEAGQVGWTDPDNRRTYPWGKEDLSLIELHRSLAYLRKKYPVLRSGSFKPVYAAYGAAAYARFDRENALIIAVNPSEEKQRLLLRAGEAGVPDGRKLVSVFMTDARGYSGTSEETEMVREGTAQVWLPAGTAVIYKV